MMNRVQQTTGLNLVSFERTQPVVAASPVASGFVLAKDQFHPSPVVAAVANAAIPEVRPEKVAQLRAAIASGNYKVSAGKLADALIAAQALW